MRFSGLRLLATDGKIFLGLLSAYSRLLALADQAQGRSITTRHNMYRDPALVARAFRVQAVFHFTTSLGLSHMGVILASP